MERREDAVHYDYVCAEELRLNIPYMATPLEIFLSDNSAIVNAVAGNCPSALVIVRAFYETRMPDVRMLSR